MDKKGINNRIASEICQKTLLQLSDAQLLPELTRCPSVKRQIQQLQNVLDAFIDDDLVKENVIQRYLPDLIPPGTKAIVRGNKFNHIVQQCILDMRAWNRQLFDVCFEKKCPIHITTEIPDWYILERATQRILIGMNQLDFWGGGQQLNRGSKYLLNNPHNHSTSKLMCVICNSMHFTRENQNKVFLLFQHGFEKNTLCYLRALPAHITNYFNL